MASAPRELPAQIDAQLDLQIRSAARKIAALSDLRGVTRIDFLSDASEVWVNEINTIPGSLARYLWIDPPIAFSTLLGDLIDEAITRPSHSYMSTGADGSILQGASSIAAKLA